MPLPHWPRRPIPRVPHISNEEIENFFYPLAIAWGLTAIAVKQSGQTAIVVAAAVGVIVCLVTTGSVVTRLKDASSE